MLPFCSEKLEEDPACSCGETHDGRSRAGRTIAFPKSSEWLTGSQQSSSVPSILLFLWFIGCLLLRDPGKYCVVTCSPLRLFAGATAMQRERALSIELPAPPRSSQLSLHDSKLGFSYVKSSLSVSDERRASAILRKEKKRRSF